MDYTISIALRHGAETVAGALYSPVADEMFTAIRGRGAFLNGERLGVSARTEVGLMAIGTGLPVQPAAYVSRATTGGWRRSATGSGRSASSEARRIHAPMSPAAG